MDQLQPAIERAKAQVLASGRSEVFAYVCRERGPDGDELVVMTDAEYQILGREDNCLAVVWSFRDGHYDAENRFHYNGKLAAAVETASDWN